MKGTHILALITTTLWAIVLLMGFGLIDGVRSQHVSGFPSEGQMRYYVYFPAALLVLVITSWALATRRHLKAPAVALIALALLILPGYFLFYTGGI
ncbi:MAG TPA: hypothetical protein VIT62_00365 [Lysobacter sp.]